MATEPTPQRVYRTACPNCGAPVEFRSAASPFAVCSFCRSTLVREGDALRRIGESAELFDDHSPLQLGAAGTYQGIAFTLIGRLQIRYAEGSWNEWHALFDNQRRAWLSEDNGQYVIGFDAPLTGDEAPRLEDLHPGEMRRVAGQVWTVGSVVRAKLAAAQGELPFPPDLVHDHLVADLRNTRGEVGTLEQVMGPKTPAASPPEGSRPASGGRALGPGPKTPAASPPEGSGPASGGRALGPGPETLVASSREGSGPASPQRWSIGRAVSLTDLVMTGLAEGAERSLASRAVACPNCGAALEPKLETTQSIVCPQCKAVVDVSKGVGADLAFFKQANPGIDGGGPQIPLGSTGALAFGGDAATPWQVVGYVERCEQPDDADDERTYWREYLLYNRIEGFAFLVDAQDGWSWSRPIPGVPESVGEHVKLAGVQYRPLYTYTGIVTYVLGEFYWRLQRDERTRNTDYQGTGDNGRKRLNREQTANEVVWSGGETLDAAVVAAAFRVPEAKQAALQRDALPISAGAGSSLVKGVVVFLVIVVIIILLSRCGSDDCDDVRRTFGASSAEYQQCQRSGGSGFRTGGGSFGGFSSGGGHK